MKCKLCSEKAAIRLRAHNISLCPLHFRAFFEKRVAATIRRYKLFAPGEKVLVAVSGGKDSLNTWFILQKLGYETTGLYIDLGIGEYSARSREKVEKFAAQHGGRLLVVELEKEIGLPLPGLVRRERRAPCATCGLIKRHVMNREARAGGFAAVATGHNLDDEAAVLLANLLNWDLGHLGRQAPLLPAWHPGLARKVKPLCEVTERESAAYAVLQGIDYITEECPYSAGATFLFYKELLNTLENRSPGTKLRFYRAFLEKGRPLFRGGERPEEELEDCPECGCPTTHPPCAFCRLRQRVATQKA